MLTTFKVTYSDGSTNITSMAAHVTLTDAREYFVGKQFNVGYYPVQNMQTAVKVEQLGRWCGTCKYGKAAVIEGSPCLPCVQNDELPNYKEATP